MTPEIEIQALKIMIQSRIVDERMITLQRQGKITFAMSAYGEEACAVGSAAALDLRDWMYPQYREAGILFWRGFPIQSYVHQMFGNAKDLTLGRQMPNHFGSRELNVVTVSSPIGTKIPHAAGCAYAMKMQKEPHIAICYFGEGATSEGDFHVGLNFAAVRKAPCIFFCRNNGFAISTPVERQFASDGIALKGEGYGIKALRINGNDFYAVYEAVRSTKELILKENGPFLIEAMTYRLGSHSTSDDPTRYRKDAEVEKWQCQCPILSLSQALKEKGLWNSALEEEWKHLVHQEIDMAIKVAENTPKPPRHSLIENVYLEVSEKLEKQLAEAEIL